MIIPEETAAQLGVDLLTTVLQSNPAQETNPADTPTIMNSLNEPAVNSPIHTNELLTTGGVDALLETQIAPPSSPITGLVFFGKFRSLLLFVL